MIQCKSQLSMEMRTYLLWFFPPEKQANAVARLSSAQREHYIPSGLQRGSPDCRLKLKEYLWVPICLSFKKKRKKEKNPSLQD